jgi:exodeoxyribonuclease III
VRIVTKNVKSLRTRLPRVLDYRAGHFHKNLGMRIDHVLLTPDLGARLVARDYRKGAKPSDHAPLVADLT